MVGISHCSNLKNFWKWSSIPIYLYLKPTTLDNAFSGSVTVSLSWFNYGIIRVPSLKNYTLSYLLKFAFSPKFSAKKLKIILITFLRNQSSLTISLCAHNCQCNRLFYTHKLLIIKLLAFKKFDGTFGVWPTRAIKRKYQNQTSGWRWSRVACL